MHALLQEEQQRQDALRLARQQDAAASNLEDRTRCVARATQEINVIRARMDAYSKVQNLVQTLDESLVKGQIAGVVATALAEQRMLLDRAHEQLSHEETRCTQAQRAVDQLK